MMLFFMLDFIMLFNMLESKRTEEIADSIQEQVEVRGVFINCETNEDNNILENEALRFQREELFKHSALQGCHQKLALTVKITSDPNESSGDEYIPIEHVFDGSNKKRTRLLNPYVLRLQRDTPLQAYKLHRIDIVTGILTNTDDRRLNKSIKNRVQRNLNEQSKQDNSGPGKRDACILSNNPARKRDRRNEHNIIVEDITDDYIIPLAEKDRFYGSRYYPSKRGDNTLKNSRKSEDLNSLSETKTLAGQAPHVHVESRRHSYDQENHKNKQNNEIISSDEDTSKSLDQSNDREELTIPKTLNKKSKHSHYEKSLDTTEKKFELYDIGNPNLWYNVHVQLFEKTSTPEGKTLWNDVTKGEIASVSSVQPEWIDQDISVKYKPTEWMSKDDFTLPFATNLCLLVPMYPDASINLSEDLVGQDAMEKYIVVPKEDIMFEDNESALNKRNGNYSDTPSNTRNIPGRHRVLIRVSRALLTDSEDLKVSRRGGDRFLVLPHRRQHHAQIDLEARADENQLIRVGGSGSLIIVVSDNSKRSRSVITAQVINKGLASARFRVKARDCGPDTASVMNQKVDSIMAGPILIPPRRTQRFRLEFTTEIPVDKMHCSVVLINDDEESIAVRDVAVKKGDRCFCVWHCDCVCLDEDPKLSCVEMAEARQASAGLSPHDRPRLARSVCYKDCVTINVFVVMVGVLMALLFLGLVKACFGLFCRCVGEMCLDRLIQKPRKLQRYYEPALTGRQVVYDDDGWPVHPDTKKRNVRQISKSMEFILNLTLFVTLPCIVMCDIIKQLNSRLKVRREEASTSKKGSKNIQDMQGRYLRRCEKLPRWMSPQAEELSNDIWRQDRFTKHIIDYEFMRPLLQERRGREQSCIDSEHEDMEYVLMQMQKSKESLARNRHSKIIESTPSTTRKQTDTEAKLSQAVIR